MPDGCGRAADWKSAIQQVGNLRYFLYAHRFGALCDFVIGSVLAAAWEMCSP